MCVHGFISSRTPHLPFGMYPSLSIDSPRSPKAASHAFNTSSGATSGGALSLYPSLSAVPPPQPRPATTSDLHTVAYPTVTWEDPASTYSSMYGSSVPSVPPPPPAPLMAPPTNQSRKFVDGRVVTSVEGSTVSEIAATRVAVSPYTSHGVFPVTVQGGGGVSLDPEDNNLVSTSAGDVPGLQGSLETDYYVSACAEVVGDDRWDNDDYDTTGSASYDDGGYDKYDGTSDNTAPSPLA